MNTKLILALLGALSILAQLLEKTSLTSYVMISVAVASASAVAMLIRKEFYGNSPGQRLADLAATLPVAFFSGLRFVEIYSGRDLGGANFFVIVVGLYLVASFLHLLTANKFAKYWMESLLSFLIVFLQGLYWW